MTKTRITALIVDDEPLARAFVRLLLKNEAEIEIIGEAGNGRDAAILINEKKPDLLFLDVQMPEMDGFSLLKTLDAKTMPAVVFTTAYEEYAIRAFEFHAIDYLLKPFDEDRFEKAVGRAKEILGDRVQRDDETTQIKELLKIVEEKPQYLERLLIKLNGRIVFLKTAEIDWIKADDKYVQIYAGSRSHLVRQTLGAMKTQLDPQRFLQIHRSAIINLERLKELQPLLSGEYIVILENGARITVSRNYKDQLFAVLGKPL